ncbi:MAG: lipocalin-like domain-containing protein [Acidobacteriota bacterium]
MKRMLAALFLGLASLTPVAAFAAGPQDLVGTWTLVSVDNILADGSRIEPYGPNPAGMLTFDAAGRYSILIFRPGRARFLSNDKSHGTPEENQATVKGTNSHFGRYSVDSEKSVLTFRIDHASFPNWEGTEQQRSFELKDGVLRYTVRTTTTGGTEVGEVTWRRPDR